MAEDDEDDRMFMRYAWDESRWPTDWRFVGDGEELMDYLFRRGQYINPSNSPRPSLVLLDLNMPKKDGREALLEIKTNDALRPIPVVVLTNSKDEEDVYLSYYLGANSFITKPATFEAFVETIRALGRYWLEVVVLPPESIGA